MTGYNAFVKGILRLARVHGVTREVHELKWAVGYIYILKFINHS